MATHLLATNLFIPSPRAEHISRVRLLTHLNTCLSHQLTLVSTPAGYGKTSLISEWAKSCACPVTWLTIDEGDNDPARLLEYMLAAFQKAGIQAAGPEPSSPGLPDRLGPLINALSALSEPVVLTLDDYHLLSSRTAHYCLAFLLDHQPDHLHIILVTRADPPIPLARLRGRGQLTEIRMADLRFTEDEAFRLVRQIEGCELSSQDVKTVTSRTEGWAAGLQMAAAARAIVLKQLAAWAYEEILFRGLILYVRISAWGHTRLGALGSVGLTAVLFTLPQSVKMFMWLARQSALLLVLEGPIIAVWWGALVVWCASIWPAIVQHFVVNAVVEVQGLTLPMVTPDTPAYQRLFWFSMPLGAIGNGLLTGARDLRHLK